MSATIAFSHPSLVLGNTVDPQLLTLFEKMKSCQEFIDAKKDRLDSLTSLKRSLEMTANELGAMKVDVSRIKDKFKDLNQSISEAAEYYMDTRINKETEIQELKEKVQSLKLSSSLGSPIDMEKSQLITKHLFQQSVKLDSQYFYFEGSNESEGLTAVENYVRNSTQNLKGESENLTKSVTDQLNHQFQNHQLSGTLIITASCTHSGVRLFSPTVFDPKKLVDSWNMNFPNDAIDHHKIRQNLEEDWPKAKRRNGKHLHYIHGAVYGSSFVGMVHLVNNANAVSTPSENIRDIIEKKIQVDSWVENATGGFGINEKSFDEIQSMLSARNISSHISMVVMGAIPTIKSGETAKGVHKFVQEWKDNVPEVFTSKNGEYETFHSKSMESGSMSRVARLEEARFRSVFKGLGEIDEKNNSVMDLGSLLLAFTNYVEKISDPDEEAIGIPIGFHIGKLSKEEIEEIWRANFFRTQTQRPNEDSDD